MSELAINPSHMEETDDFIDTQLTRPIRIVYRDEHYVGVYKPAGLVVHRGSRTGADEPILLQALRDQLGCLVYPVHRLDRPTAGLILFALNPDAAARFVDLLTLRRVEKYYQALVRGHTPSEMILDTPLPHHDEGSLAEQSENEPSTLQTAKTYVRSLAWFNADWKCEGEDAPFSLLEVQPTTGRWHQIRRHLERSGYPIVGDLRYGHAVCNTWVHMKTGVPRMLLTSMRLDFRHPYSGELTSIMVSRGTWFDRVLEGVHRYTPQTSHQDATTNQASR